jgi:hypothetical protein
MLRTFACFSMFSVALAIPVAANASAVVFDSQPASQTHDAHAVFRFHSDGAQRYECALNQTAYRDCSSPHVVLDLPPGEQQMRVRSVDAFGEAGPESIVEWRVDSVFPGHQDLVRTQQQPDAVAPNSWRGIFRINCDFAYASYDDPIVYPGQADAAHYHKFFGSLFADYNTDIESLHRLGPDQNARYSSCQGNGLNRSAYWYPTLLAPRYDDADQAIVDGSGDDQWQTVEAVVGNDEVAHEVFYYSAGVDNLTSIQPLPLGLRMIAGNPNQGTEGFQDSSIIRWHCQSWESDDANNPDFRGEIPECVAPDRLRADIFFPSCWNGVDLDSDDHKSHMAYPVDQGGRDGMVCPDSHPVPVVRVSYHLAFPVKPDNYEPASRSSRSWRLASDSYLVSEHVRGGRSLHADWINAWHPEVMQALLENCIQSGLDCHDGNLANGWRLSGTAPGSQNLPSIINNGHGPSMSDDIAPERTLWWDRSRPGHGLDLQRIGDSYFAIFYSYDDLGEPIWYLATGEMQGERFAGHAQRFDYHPDRDPKQRPVPESGGALRIDFASDSTTEACQDGVDRSAARHLASFTFTTALGQQAWCVEPLLAAPQRPDPDRTGTWMAPEESDRGWGLSIAQAGQEDMFTVAVLYYYDAAGVGRWAYANGAHSSTANHLDLPAWEFFIEPSARVLAGEVTLRFDHDPHNLWLNTVVQHSGSQAGAWARQSELIPLSDAP